MIGLTRRHEYKLLKRRKRKWPSIEESIASAERGLIDDRHLYLELSDQEWAEYMEEVWANLERSPDREKTIALIEQLPQLSAETRQRIAETKARWAGQSRAE